MINKNYWGLLWIACSVSLFGQRVHFEGKVIDSLGSPITAANIIAMEEESGILDAFGISDESGNFRMNLKKDFSYNIKVSYLGFETTEFNLKLYEDYAEVITLKEQDEALDEVELTYEMPVTIKGDTIVYNADSFNTGTEKKLEDVLKNLPGIEINADGQIEVEGKQVSKVLVEGKEFFDGDSKLATQNIPSNVVGKIEVLRNFNDVSQMRSVTDNEDNVALNIRLKDGKKRFWFGEVSVAAANDDGSWINPKIFYYSPERSVNFIGNLNNIGKSPLTRRDFFNFSGGFRNASQNNGTQINITSDDLGLTSLTNNRAQSQETQFGATNFSLSPNKKLDLNGFVIGSKSTVNIFQKTTRTYVADGQKEITTDQVKQVNAQGLYKIATVYKPSDRFQADYDLLVKQSVQDEISDFSTTVQSLEEIDTYKKQEPSALNQKLSVYATLSNNHILTMNAQHSYQKEDPFYQAIRENQPFSTLLPFDQNQSNFNINQSRVVKTNLYAADLSYYYVISPKINLNTLLGTNQSRQNFQSSIFQVLDSGVSQNLPASFENDVQYSFSDIYTGLSLRWVSGMFRFNPGFTVHRYVMNDQQLGGENKRSFNRFAPDMSMTINFKKSEFLRLNYSIQTEFTDVVNLASSYVLRNYNQLFRGSRNLEAASFERYALNYNNLNTFNFTYIFANFSFSKRIDAVKTTNVFEGINRISTPFNSPFADQNINASGRIQKRFSKIKTEGSVRLSWSERNNIVNANPTVSKSFTQNYNASFGTNFKTAPNLELGYNFTANRYNNGVFENTFFTHRPFARLDVLLGKSWVFTADYSHYEYRDSESTLNRYSALEARLSYQKPDSKWEFSLEGTNLVANDAINSDAFNEIFSTTTSYAIQPRYVLLMLKYNL